MLRPPDLLLFLFTHRSLPSSAPPIPARAGVLPASSRPDPPSAESDFAAASPSPRPGGPPGKTSCDIARHGRSVAYYPRSCAAQLFFDNNHRSLIPPEPSVHAAKTPIRRSFRFSLTLTPPPGFPAPNLDFVRAYSYTPLPPSSPLALPSASAPRSRGSPVPCSAVRGD